MKAEEIDRIECAIRHIQTATDVDPWAADIAVDAMRKQIPMKPVIGYTKPESFREMLKKHNSMDKIALSKTECCPVCSRRLDKSEFAKAMKGLSVGPPYCRYCGQAIDWRQGNERD